MTTPGQPPWPSAEPDRTERVKLALAIVGLVFVTLLGWLVYNLVFSLLDFLFTLWGILVLLGLIVSGAAFVVALAFTRGRRPPPGPEAAPHAATAESLETRQM